MKIIPIKDLRDTKKIIELTHHSSPVFITKNGYEDLVILTHEDYQQLLKNHNVDLEKNKLSINNKINYLPNPNEHYGFVKVGAANFLGDVANVEHNYQEIIRLIHEANKHQIQILVFPELSLTSYSSNDMFFQDTLYQENLKYLLKLKEFSKAYNMFIAVGACLRKDNCLYNVAVIYFQGEILGVVPKSNISNSEKRYFKNPPLSNDEILIGEDTYPFGNKLIFVNQYDLDLKIAITFSNDLFSNLSPSQFYAQVGATIILNLSAVGEVVGETQLRREIIKTLSFKEKSAYIYCSASYGESTTDNLFSGHCLISENGQILNENELFSHGLIYSDIDLQSLINARKDMIFEKNNSLDEYLYIPFKMEINKAGLDRKIAQNPFILPLFKDGKNNYQTIIKMQAYSLLKRFKSARASKLIVGLSGGLDSTLAFLVSLETLKLLNLDNQHLIAISLPSFGTSKRTYANSEKLAKKMNVDYREINISKTIESHFKDIDHDLNNHNACYENAQARERTQVLLDIANDENALMVGTGDLSELCLGWCTYNGDHMSNYGVNASLPKTAIREIVRLYAFDHLDVKDVLLDIVNTPISPELLPPKEGEIAQKTEDSVGPYELHDFFIYYFLKEHYSMKKILYLANVAFKDKYDEETIKKWLKVFIKRFFTSQFKRSCAVDGVKISEISLSPRTDLKMSSDTSFETFLQSIEKNL